MTGLSLFSGAGIGELVFKHIFPGYRTIGYVEWDKYCQQIIRQRIKDGWLDDAPIFGDIRQFNERYANLYAGKVDWLSGGFPCQPFSVAGRQLGEADERNMWPDTLSAIQKIRPKYVLLENVPGLLSAKSSPCVCGWPYRRRGLYWDTIEQGKAILRGDHSRDVGQSGGVTGSVARGVWGDGVGVEDENGPLGGIEQVEDWWSCGYRSAKEAGAVSVVEARTSDACVETGGHDTGIAKTRERDSNLGRECGDGGAGDEAGDAPAEQERPKCQRCGRRLFPSDARPIWYIQEILGDLAEIGYDAEWDVVGASDVGANHRRKRWWCLAHDTQCERIINGPIREIQGEEQTPNPDRGREAVVADSERMRSIQPQRREQDERKRAGDSGKTLAYPKGPERELTGDSRSWGDGPANGSKDAPDTASSRQLRAQEPQDDGADSAGGGRHDVDNIREDVADPAGKRPQGSGESQHTSNPEADRKGERDNPEHGGWWSVEPDVGRVAHELAARMDKFNTNTEGEC